jgi:hypothetical protein
VIIWRTRRPWQIFGRVPGAAARADRYYFTDSIDVCAVAIMRDALYKDLQLSGKRVRALGTSPPTAG